MTTHLEETLEERFKKRGFSNAAYAKAHGYDPGTLFKILRGRFRGERNTQRGKVRAIIVQLKADGIWIEPLPWEEKAA